ncbi:MAG: helix-turn-helix transcriptional regulator [Lachnospiraceae bacterium]|nr:helix-turn-helix transcriptional regulator [Lachnospiraceae bacterium]
MDQKKIGGFLKELRKEKGVTQEQLAEAFCVSNRTVSRWENGNNMPDLDILIEISDYYEVDLRDILNGERKQKTMEKEMKETVLQAVEYTNVGSERCHKRVRLCCATGMLIFVITMILNDSALAAEHAFVRTGCDIAQGVALGIMLCGLIISSRYGAAIKAFKKRIFKKEC